MTSHRPLRACLPWEYNDLEKKSTLYLERSVNGPMEPSQVLDLAHEALLLTLKLGLPVLLVALVVGLVISLIQALTQIQEMTLSFVPKIIAVFATLWLMMPLLSRWLGQFTWKIFEHIGRM